MRDLSYFDQAWRWWTAAPMTAYSDPDFYTAAMVLLEKVESGDIAWLEDVATQAFAPTDVSSAHFVRKILDGYAWHLRHKVSAGALPSQPTACVNLHREV